MDLEAWKGLSILCLLIREERLGGRQKNLGNVKHIDVV